MAESDTSGRLPATVRTTVPAMTARSRSYRVGDGPDLVAAGWM